MNAVISVVLFFLSSYPLCPSHPVSPTQTLCTLSVPILPLPQKALPQTVLGYFLTGLFRSNLQPHFYQEAFGTHPQERLGILPACMDLPDASLLGTDCLHIVA